MNKHYLGSVILLCLVSIVVTQNFNLSCSIYCRACNTSKGNQMYGECIPSGGQSCPNEFISTGSPADVGTPNCTIDPDIYGFVEQLANEDFVFDPDNTSGKCSAFGQYTITKGFYTINALISVRKDTLIVDPHYRLRVMVSVVFINVWDDMDALTFTITPNISFNIRRNNGSSTSLGDLCNSSGTTQRFVKYDSGTALTHYATAFNFTIAAPNRCKTCTGSSCNCYWMVAELLLALKLCDISCSKCTGPNNTQCSECTTGYILSGTTCAQACLSKYFQNTTASPVICSLCDNSCAQCSQTKTNCTTCSTNYKLFINNSTYNTCLTSCPQEDYYYSSDLGRCDSCDVACKECSGSADYCKKCHDGYFLYQNSCPASCPSSYFSDSTNNMCLDCNINCVSLVISRYIPSGSAAASSLMFDLNFSSPIDFSNYTLPDFQSLDFKGSLSLQNFNITYSVLSSRAYRIILTPYSYAFIVNQSVTLTVRSRPEDFNYSSSDGRPFMDMVFNQTLSVIWNYIKPPSMTDFQKSIVSTLSGYSSSMNDALALPGVQQIKKFGFLFLVLNSLQITSCLVLLNTIMPENLYEGIRFFASFIFFDVPPWQQQSSKTKFIINNPLSSLPTRRLLTTYIDQFNFRKTGFSGIFLYDAYSQMLLIGCCYAALGLCLLITKYCKKKSKINKAERFFLKCLNAFHEISVMYFTLTIVFQITYFHQSSIKWASVIICFIVNIYYMLYQIRIYYILLQFPSIPLNDPKFQQFITKYSYYLKNIKFDEDRVYSGEWAIYKLWFRPHNYHILSYIKKFMMMLTFPIFYKFGFAQISALLIIQFFQILRFIFTWPYIQKWRNIFRLVLEFILFTIFGLILFIELLVLYMTAGNTQTSQMWATYYFLIGWIAFGLICVYNISFLLLFCLNWYQDCNYTNRQILEKSRRKYYFQKLRQYENNYDIVPMDLVNQCVKKGNLNKRKTKQLPQVLQRIQYYAINIIQGQVLIYNIDAKVITQLSMGTEYNYTALHNLTAKKMIQTANILQPNNVLYNTIHSAYQKFKKKLTSHIIIKTFVDVDQKKYKFNEVIPIGALKVSHQIQIHSINKHQPEIVSLKQPLVGFPIPHFKLYMGLDIKEDFLGM